MIPKVICKFTDESGKIQFRHRNFSTDQIFISGRKMWRGARFFDLAKNR